MSSISLSPPLPEPVCTNLAAVSVIGGIQLTWVVPNDETYLETQVWASLTNDRSTATHVATIKGSTFTHAAPSGQVWFYWIRAVSIYGRFGDFVPDSETPVDEDTGWVTPGSNDIWQLGTSASANLGNVTTEDGTFATVTTDTFNLVDGWMFYNFGFALSDEMAVNAVQLKLKGKVSVPGSSRVNARLCMDGGSFDTLQGAVTSADYLYEYLTGTNTTYIMGSDSSIDSTWGKWKQWDTEDIRSWHVSDFMDSDFGIMLTGSTSDQPTWSYDYIAVKLYYSYGGGVRGIAGINTYGDWQVSGALYIEDDITSVSGNILFDEGDITTSHGDIEATAGNVIVGNELKVPYTNTATVGAVTINAISGRVNIASSGTSVTVTNSHVTSASHVIATVSTNDTNAYVKNVVPGSGSFVIRLGAAAAAQTSIDFVVFN